MEEQQYYTFKYECTFYPLPGLSEEYRTYESNGYGKIVNPKNVINEGQDVKHVIKQRMIDSLNHILHCFFQNNIPEVILFNSDSNENIQSMKETYERMWSKYGKGAPIACIIIISHILSNKVLIEEDDGANYKLIIDNIYNQGCVGEFCDNLYDLYGTQMNQERSKWKRSKLIEIVLIVTIFLICFYINI